MTFDTVGKILIGGLVAITGVETVQNVVKYVKARKSRIKAEQELDELLANVDEQERRRELERKEAEEIERWKAELEKKLEEERRNDTDTAHYRRLINSAKRMCKMVEEEA